MADWATTFHSDTGAYTLIFLANDGNYKIYDVINSVDTIPVNPSVAEDLAALPQFA